MDKLFNRIIKIFFNIVQSMLLQFDYFSSFFLYYIHICYNITAPRISRLSKMDLVRNTFRFFLSSFELNENSTSISRSFSTPRERFIRVLPRFLSTSFFFPSISGLDKIFQMRDIVGDIGGGHRLSIILPPSEFWFSSVYGQKPTTALSEPPCLTYIHIYLPMQ